MTTTTPLKKMRRSVYLDYNGSVPLRPEARQAIIETLDVWGNPSAVHTQGNQARCLLEEARMRIARVIGARPEEIIFTSGGTESNALALQGLMPQVNKIFIGATEHDAVRQQNTQAIPLTVNTAGQIEPERLEALLENVAPPFLCSICWGHNETGVLNDVVSLARVIHQKGGFFHTDAVQVLGKLPISFEDADFDLMTISAHKVGGPAGIGALVAKESVPLKAFLRGGGQERGMRSGTPSVALAQGFAAALEAAEQKKEEVKQFAVWQKTIEEHLQSIAPNLQVIGQEALRLPNTSCVTMPGVKAEVQLMAFDLEGIAVSAGAACSSGKIAASTSLRAMGFPEKTAQTAIRISTGWGNCDTDIKQFLTVWEEIYERLGAKQRIAYK